MKPSYNLNDLISFIKVSQSQGYLPRTETEKYLVTDETKAHIQNLILCLDHIKSPASVKEHFPYVHDDVAAQINPQKIKKIYVSFYKSSWGYDGLVRMYGDNAAQAALEVLRSGKLLRGSSSDRLELELSGSKEWLESVIWGADEFEGIKKSEFK
jgi:hypothetical protein